MKSYKLVTYRWDDSSAIGRMEVETAARKMLRVRLYANENAEAGSLKNVPEILKRHGFIRHYADTRNGEQMLVLQDITDPQSLINVLEEVKLVNGERRKETHLTEKELEQAEHKTLWERVQRDSLKWSGRVGLIGHAAMAGAGIMQGDTSRVIAAPLGAANPIILGRYGNGQDFVNFDKILKQMREYFAEEGVVLPQIDNPEQYNTLVGAIDHFFGQHPVEIGAVVGSLGSAKLMESAWNDKSWGRGIAGSTSLTGNMAVLGVPERRPGPDEEKKGNLTALKDLGVAIARDPAKAPDAVWGFIRQSPLRFNAMLNFTDNIMFAWDAFYESKKFATRRSTGKDGHGKKINGIKHKISDLRKDPKFGEAESGIIKEITGLRNEEKILERELAIATDPIAKFSPYLSVITALSFTVATGLASMASKNADQDSRQDEMFERLYASTAKILANLPEERRYDVLHRMSGFLAAQPALRDGRITVEKLEEEIISRVDDILDSPWLDKSPQKRQPAKQPTKDKEASDQVAAHSSEEEEKTPDTTLAANQRLTSSAVPLDKQEKWSQKAHLSEATAAESLARV